MKAPLKLGEEAAGREWDRANPRNAGVLVNSAVALTALVSMSGCASVMSGPRKNVSINSNPPGAHVSVADKKGREVASLTTPCVANLKRYSIKDLSLCTFAFLSFAAFSNSPRVAM